LTGHGEFLRCVGIDSIGLEEFADAVLDLTERIALRIDASIFRKGPRRNLRDRYRRPAVAVKAG
jgi:hypothetical protein